jgi:hypothetical protein
LTADQVHAEALRLSENEALALILSEIDTAARDGLVATPADKIEQIRDHQAMARAVYTIRERVRLLVAGNAPKKPSGLA